MRVVEAQHVDLVNIAILIHDRAPDPPAPSAAVQVLKLFFAVGVMQVECVSTQIDIPATVIAGVLDSDPFVLQLGLDVVEDGQADDRRRAVVVVRNCGFRVQEGQWEEHDP